MSDIRRASQSTEPFPTHEQIEKRAYEIYLERGREQGRALDHWRTAEDQLLHEHDLRAEHSKSTTIVVAPDSTAEIIADRDIAIAEEEGVQVRASEELNEKYYHSGAQRARAASAEGQSR